MNREDIADKVLTDGYNCAAAVVLAYIENNGLALCSCEFAVKNAVKILEENVIQLTYIKLNKN